MENKRVVGWFLLAALAGGTCAGLAAEPPRSPPPETLLHRYSFEQVHMGQAIKAVLYAPDEPTANLAAAAAYERIAQLDQIMSDYKPDSELSRLSQTAGTDRAVPLGDELWLVLNRAQRLAAASDGAFDVTVGSYVRLWRRARQLHEFPSADRLAEARAAVGHQLLRLDAESKTAELLAPGMRLDLGGIAAGYAADEALAVLARRQVTRAMIDFSGDVVVGDPPPGAAGWKIGIAPVTDANGPPSRFLLLKNVSVTTSGDAFQHVEFGGKRYSHIVDPHTGLGLTDQSSVTVVARDGITADSLATAVSVLGPRRGLELIEKTEGAAALIARNIEGKIETHESQRFGEFAVGTAETVKLRRDGKVLEVRGQLVVEAEDGGLLLLGRDGVLWSVEPQEIVEHTSDVGPFKPLAADELGELLLGELPKGFEVYATQHYLICHNTSKAYAQWCGALFERLYMAFTNYWSRKKFVLSEPQFPLVALVFADQESYASFAADELGEGAKSIIGYYSLRTNRMTMYDLTGVEAMRQPGDRRGSSAQINLMLSRPEAERTVATVIHEATHQIAFNCGLQTRYADIPYWLSEGIAMYFETPDLGSSKGWRNIGAVNQVRLAGFRDYLPRRLDDSLSSLLAGNDRLRDPKLAGDAYAEAWALNYFLIKQRPKQYLEYIKALSEKQALLSDDPQTKIDEFEQAFGDLEQLDGDFVRQMKKLK